jgi:predicted nucleic acid-binding protein
MVRNKYLIDTAIIIDAFHDNKSAQIFLDKLPNTTISIMTQAELLEGSRNKTEMLNIQNTIIDLSVIYPSMQIFLRAIKYVETYFLSHGLLFDDALIAATAVENGLTLATTEKKHFKPINNLLLYHPY